MYRRGELGIDAAEGLDRQPAVVPDLLQCLEGLVPSDLSAPGRATVAFTDMDVVDAIATGADCCADVVLLEVRVVGIVVDTDGCVVDAV